MSGLVVLAIIALASSNGVNPVVNDSTKLPQVE